MIEIADHVFYIEGANHGRYPDCHAMFINDTTSVIIDPACREELMRQSLQTDVWGHLPPQVRQQLLNGLNERMLPGYEALIRQFYSTLAEGAKTRPSESRPNQTR